MGLQKTTRVIGELGIKPLFGFFGSRENQKLFGGSPKNHKACWLAHVKPRLVCGTLKNHVRFKL